MKIDVVMVLVCDFLTPFSVVLASYRLHLNDRIGMIHFRPDKWISLFRCFEMVWENLIRQAQQSRRETHLGNGFGRAHSGLVICVTSS
jgi:hypothetical protein